MKKNTKTIIALVVLAALIIGATLLYKTFAPAAQVGAKHVEIAVIHADGSSKDFSLDTDAETLRAALDELGIIEGDEGEYGLYVTAVDGESADADAQQWWCFTKGGEMLMTSVDNTMIQDGEHYEVTFTVGW